MNLTKIIAHLAIIAAAMGSLVEAGKFSQHQQSVMSKGPVAPKPAILAPATFAPTVTPAPTTSTPTPYPTPALTTGVPISTLIPTPAPTTSVETPAPIATPAATTGGSTETPAPIATPAATTGGSTETPAPIATPEATPVGSTDTPNQTTPETPAATPAPTTAVETPAPIATPEATPVGSTETPAPRDAGGDSCSDGDASADCDSGGHPCGLDRYAEPNHAGDAGSDSCSDDRGRNASADCDSGGHHWRLDGDAGADCDSGGHHWRLDGDAGADCDSGGHPCGLDRYAEPNHAGDAGSDSCSDDRGRNASADCDSGGHHWRLDADAGADCDNYQSTCCYINSDACNYDSGPGRCASFDPLPNNPCSRYDVVSNLLPNNSTSCCDIGTDSSAFGCGLE
ncbi:hypothetical protein PF002_g23448 [Phytophthora fragariae]|uniref:Uncharacterized protein n=1 Tax=Phytophthora fragariae TaxID=53985 RepID=A0A6A3X1W1_9STRA|nr:hypothetical protein PF002_g23448 [Phytophthora fragariae]